MLDDPAAPIPALEAVLSHATVRAESEVPRTATPPSKKGPATFEEMGFKSQPLEGKDCIIM